MVAHVSSSDHHAHPSPQPRHVDELMAIQLSDSHPLAHPPLQPRRVDEPMAAHLEAENIDFIQFAWRWVNCLLIREMPFHLSFRLWDTYLAEGSRFCDFLVGWLKGEWE